MKNTHAPASLCPHLRGLAFNTKHTFPPLHLRSLLDMLPGILPGLGLATLYVGIEALTKSGGDHGHDDHHHGGHTERYFHFLKFSAHCEQWNRHSNLFHVLQPHSQMGEASRRSTR